MRKVTAAAAEKPTLVEGWGKAVKCLSLQDAGQDFAKLGKKIRRKAETLQTVPAAGRQKPGTETTARFARGGIFQN